MAVNILGRRGAALLCQKTAVIRCAATRCLAVSATLHQQQPQQATPSAPPAVEKEKNWFQRLLPVRSIDPGKESHSSLLSDKDVVYELQIHAVKPDSLDEYLSEYAEFVVQVDKRDLGAELVGSWTVEVGDQDEAIHIWKYPGGYSVLNHTAEVYREDEEFRAMQLKRNKMLRSRRNQILLAFSFWGDIKQRPGNSIYELRSYVLKPGTMIEWGNNWARGLQSRMENHEAVAGFFAQIGELYTVQHLWAYDDLESRKQVRAAAWAKPGWDECVAYTVPLIRHMKARILIPTSFSPLQ